MKHVLAVLVSAAIVGTSACAAATSAPDPAPPAQPAPTPPPGQEGKQAVNPHAKAMADFQARLKDYLALREKLNKELPPLSNEATPEEIHKHQLALAARIRETRRTARPGDIFSPDMRVIVRTLMAQVFGGAEGKQLKSDIMDENPGRIRVAINDRYPDNVPLSTVPPQVLKGLPKLPTKVEYRFLGRALILLDIEAHLIVDIMENAIP